MPSLFLINYIKKWYIYSFKKHLSFNEMFCKLSIFYFTSLYEPLLLFLVGSATRYYINDIFLYASLSFKEKSFCQYFFLLAESQAFDSLFLTLVFGIKVFFHLGIFIKLLIYPLQCWKEPAEKRLTFQNLPNQFRVRGSYFLFLIEHDEYSMRAVLKESLLSDVFFILAKPSDNRYRWFNQW